MRTTMRVFMLSAGALVVSLFACHSEQVVKAASCSDPCCGGHPTLIDCGENRNISCIESGDPCAAQAFGCVSGVFFEKAQDLLPTGCAEGDGGPDAAMSEELDGGLFASDDSTSPDSAAGSGPDAMLDGESDATAICAPDAADAADGACQ